MTRLARIACLTIAVTLIGTLTARADNVLPLFPSDAETFMCLDVEKLVRSELFQKYLGESLRNDASLKAAGEKTGVRSLKRIVAVNGAPREGGKFGRSGIGIMAGEFIPDRVMAFARELAENEQTKEYVAIVQEKGRPMVKVTIKWGEKIEFYAAVVDSERIVFGADIADVVSALDRAASKAAPAVRNKTVVERFSQIPPSSVFYVYQKKFLTTQDLLFLQKTRSPIDDPAISKLLLEKVTEFRLDLRVASDIKLVAALEMADENAAKELRPIASKLCEKLKAEFNALVLQYPKLKPLEDVWKNLKISRTGKTVELEASLSEETIIALVKSAQGK